LARGRQIHGATVARVLAAQDSPATASRQTGEGGEGRTLGEADGQVTALRGLGLMVLTADCLPVALAGPGAVAVLHAGWRGLAAGILEQGVRALRDLSGDGELQAVIGPGAGPCCY